VLAMNVVVKVLKLIKQPFVKNAKEKRPLKRKKHLKFQLNKVALLNTNQFSIVKETKFLIP